MGRPGSKKGMPALRALVAAPLLLGGCKIVSIEADRAARESRSAAFDATAYVDRSWRTRVLPQVEKSAISIGDLNRELAGGIDEAGAAHGRRAAEGSPWTFVVRGEGVVTAIDDKSRSGSIELAVPVAGGTRVVTLQTGPVIVDTAVRDSLPFVTFNDFADQIAFANAGRALTDRALTETRAARSGLVMGDRLRFLGPFNLAAADAPIRITAVRLERVPAGTKAP